MTEAELRIERQRLIRRQHEIAAAINSLYPRPVGQPNSAWEDSLRREANDNVLAIRSIDAELATEGRPTPSATIEGEDG